MVYCALVIRPKMHRHFTMISSLFCEGDRPLLVLGPLLSSHSKKGQNILKEFDDHYDEARYVGDC